MPNWQPNWQDVRWNWAAADRAASDLERGANDLEWTANDHRRLAESACLMWQGGYREQFDGRFVDVVHGAHDLASGYRGAAARIRRASQEAADEQARRVRDRERWHHEKDDEDRRARESRDRHDRDQRAKQKQQQQAAGAGTSG